MNGAVKLVLYKQKGVLVEVQRTTAPLHYIWSQKGAQSRPKDPGELLYTASHRLRRNCIPATSYNSLTWHFASNSQFYNYLGSLGKSI